MSLDVSKNIKIRIFKTYMLFWIHTDAPRRNIIRYSFFLFSRFFTFFTEFLHMHDPFGIAFGWYLFFETFFDALHSKLKEMILKRYLGLQYKTIYLSSMPAPLVSFKSTVR